MGSFYVPRFTKVRLHVEGDRVQLVHNGTLLMDLHWQAAKELSRALRQSAARAEQSVKIAQVVTDQAVLIRAGFPLALTTRPDVFKEAGNEAAHNRELRRAIPGGIPSGVKFGTPTLVGKPANSAGGKNGR